MLLPIIGPKSRHLSHFAPVVAVRWQIWYVWPFAFGLGYALGIIAAFMIGEIAISVGLFTGEVVLYMAIAVWEPLPPPVLSLPLPYD